MTGPCAVGVNQAFAADKPVLAMRPIGVGIGCAITIVCARIRVITLRSICPPIHICPQVLRRTRTPNHQRQRRKKNSHLHPPTRELAAAASDYYKIVSTLRIPPRPPEP